MRERDEGRPERVGGAQQRPEVPGIRDAPEREPDRQIGPARQVRAPEDGDDPRRVGEGREARHHVGRDELRPRKALGQRRPLGVDQRLHGLESGLEPCFDEILALADEQPELLALTARLELPDELDPRVGRGRDHTGETRPRARPWPARRSS